MNRIGTAGRAVRMIVRTVLFLMTVVAVGLAAEMTAGPSEDFRAWTHTKSMVIVDRSNGLYGIHNIYANDIALPTLKKGGSYRDGAEFAASFHEVETKDGGMAQGKRIKTGFMRKDVKATKTDGWIYSARGSDGTPKEIDPVKACFECHAKAKDSDFIFSRYVE